MEFPIKLFKISQSFDSSAKIHSASLDRLFFNVSFEFVEV